MCRYTFFTVVDEEQEERYHRNIIRRVGWPSQEGQAREDSSTSESTWYDYFVEAAAEQYQESLTRARIFLARNFPGSNEAEREEQFRSFYTSYTSEEEMQHRIALRATAFRTMDVRDWLLYLKFGAEGFLPSVTGPIRAPLNAEQLEALFHELRRRGAFEEDLHPFPHYAGLTDHQMWLLHREEGESYSPWEGGYWSLSLS